VSSTDLNGDGYSDVIIGAWYADTENDTGKVYIFFGTNYIFSTPEIKIYPDSDLFTTIIGESSQSYLGIKMAAGDFNGDSFGDLLVGAHAYSSQNVYQSGASYIIKGHKNFDSSGQIYLDGTFDYIIKITGEHTQDHL